MARVRGSFYWLRDPTEIGKDIEKYVDKHVYARAERVANTLEGMLIKYA